MRNHDHLDLVPFRNTLSESARSLSGFKQGRTPLLLFHPSLEHIPERIVLFVVVEIEGLVNAPVRLVAAELPYGFDENRSSSLPCCCGNTVVEACEK